MSFFRRFSIGQWIAGIGLSVILGGFLVPDSATVTRRSLEERAERFVAKGVGALADKSMIATDVRLEGTWVCRSRLSGSAFVFSPRADGQFDAAFRTSGCLGGCDLGRVARLGGGVIRLDAAVAEYLPRTYDMLYVVRVDGNEYLLPAESLSDFERELDADSAGWQSCLYQRDE